MSKAKVYADFHNLDDSNRLRLNCAGTIDDLRRQGIELREGLPLTFCMDDADDHGAANALWAEGVVHYDACDRAWVASVDWSSVLHESDESKSKVDAAEPSQLEPTDENGLTHHAGGPDSPTAKSSGQAKGVRQK